MLLTADPQLAIDADRARRDDRHVAVSNPQRLREKAAGVDSLFDREDGGQRLECGGHFLRTEPGGLNRLSQHPCDRLVVEQHLSGKQRLITPVRPAVALAGNIGLSQHRRHPWHFQSPRRVQPCRHRVGVRRPHGPRVQQSGKSPAKVVDVQRLAGHVPARAFVRERRRDRHCRCSQ